MLTLAPAASLEAAGRATHFHRELDVATVDDEERLDGPRSARCEEHLEWKDVAPVWITPLFWLIQNSLIFGSKNALYSLSSQNSSRIGQSADVWPPQGVCMPRTYGAGRPTITRPSAPLDGLADTFDLHLEGGVKRPA